MNILTKPEPEEDGSLEIEWRRTFSLTRSAIESTTKDANWPTALAISSSDLYARDFLISGEKQTFPFAFSLANSTPFFHSPWYRTEANAHTTRESWGLFTNARWNASNPTLYHIKTTASQMEIYGFNSSRNWH